MRRQNLVRKWSGVMRGIMGLVELLSVTTNVDISAKLNGCKVNAWRPIRGEVLDAPLAVADARTLSKEAKVVHKIIYRDR